MSEAIFRGFSGAPHDWSDAKIRAFLDAAPDAIVVVDDSGTILAVNELTARMFGYTREEMVKRRVEMLVPERYRAAHMRHRADYASDPRTRPMGRGRALTGRKRDGSEFPIEISLSPFTTEIGTAVISIIRDITDRLRAEAKFRGFLESAPDAVVVVDTEGIIAVANPLAERIFGYKREEILGQPMEKIIPECRPRIEAVLSEEVPGISKVEAGHELTGRRKDGSSFPIEISLSPLDTEQGTLVISIIRDTTQKKQAEMKFRGLLESAPDAIVVANTEGGIAIVNSQAETMFGYSRRQMLGQSLQKLIPDPQVMPPRSTVAGDDASARIKTSARRMNGVRHDGVQFPIEISQSPLETEEGVLVICIIRDISERLRAEEERRQLMASHMRAEEISRAKDQFLMTLSHELRTPLTAILGWSTMLSMEELQSPFVRSAIDAIHNSAVTQARLIDDVLEMSRLIEGKVHLDLEMTDPVAVARSAIQSVRPTAEAKRIRIVTQIDSDVGLVTADPARLQQIMWNLLSNAIKFSHKNSVVTLVLDQQDTNVEIIVRDTGEGIAPQFLPFIFEPFLQADSSTTRTQSGLGLGLSIVRQLVELHGGRVEATSAGVGKGAEVRVLMPAAPADATLATPMLSHESPLPEAYPDLTGISILCVDDDAESRLLLRALLERGGAKVYTAGSVPEGLDVFDRQHPDIVITDIAMPYADGYELVERLSSRRQVPVIALSALTRLEKKHYEKLFAAYIRKPAEPAQIAWAVAYAMKRAQDQAPQPQS